MNANSPDDLSRELETVECCPFCKSHHSVREIEDARDLFFSADTGSFDFNRCQQCRALWLDRQPVGARLLQAYSQYYTHAGGNQRARAMSYRDRLRRAYARARYGISPTLVDRALQAGLRIAGFDTADIDAKYRFSPKAPAKMLDYGCGSGAFLRLMAPFGHELCGAEYDPALLKGLRQEGIAIEDVANLRDDRWQAEFDHITLAHVLEHVPDPPALLARLSHWLKPGGTLFVELPNADAVGLTIFEQNWRGLEVPRHFALPSRQGLIDALSAAGLVLEFQHIDRSARSWVWQESLETAAADHHGELRARMASAPAENAENAELLTVLARKPECA